MDLINSKKHWSLRSTLIITLFVFLLFSLIQTLILLLYTSSSQEILTENVAYENIGVISIVSSIIGIIFLISFIKFESGSVKQYLNLYFVKPQNLCTQHQY